MIIPRVSTLHRQSTEDDPSSKITLVYHIPSIHHTQYTSFKPPIVLHKEKNVCVVCVLREGDLIT